LSRPIALAYWFGRGGNATKRIEEEETMTTEASIAMSKRVALSYPDAVAQVKSALQEEGFGVLTEVDIRATLKQKLDADFRDYVIIGACNPPLAHRALQSDLDVGLLLPCNVIVYEADGGSMVSIFDPEVGMALAGVPALEPIAREAKERLVRVLARL
jgi:uncharacterized protein (DUF302 family)